MYWSRGIGTSHSAARRDRQRGHDDPDRPRAAIRLAHEGALEKSIQSPGRRLESLCKGSITRPPAAPRDASARDGGARPPSPSGIPRARATSPWLISANSVRRSVRRSFSRQGVDRSAEPLLVFPRASMSTSGASPSGLGTFAAASTPTKRRRRASAGGCSPGLSAERYSQAFTVASRAPAAGAARAAGIPPERRHCASWGSHSRRTTTLNIGFSILWYSSSIAALVSSAPDFTVIGNRH